MITMTAGLPKLIQLQLWEVDKVSFNLANQPAYDEAVDKEWIALILAAKMIGLTPQDVRNFLLEAQRRESQKE